MDTTLNLLPQERKKIICQKRQMRSLWRWEAMLTLIIAIFCLMLLSIWYIVGLNGEALLEGDRLFEAQKIQRQQVLDLQNEWREANHLIADVSDITNDQLAWSNVFLTINKNISEGVVLNQVSSDGLLVNLSGQASTRESLIAFKDKLNSADCFDNVDLPFSNLVLKENIDFKINLKVKRDCLK